MNRQAVWSSNDLNTFPEEELGQQRHGQSTVHVEMKRNLPPMRSRSNDCAIRKCAPRRHKKKRGGGLGKGSQDQNVSKDRSSSRSGNRKRNLQRRQEVSEPSVRRELSSYDSMVATVDLLLEAMNFQQLELFEHHVELVQFQMNVTKKLMRCRSVIDEQDSSEESFGKDSNERFSASWPSSSVSKSKGSKDFNLIENDGFRSSPFSYADIESSDEFWSDHCEIFTIAECDGEDDISIGSSQSSSKEEQGQKSHGQLELPGSVANEPNLLENTGSEMIIFENSSPRVVQASTESLEPGGGKINHADLRHSILRTKSATSFESARSCSSHSREIRNSFSGMLKMYTTDGYSSSSSDEAVPFLEKMADRALGYFRETLSSSDENVSSLSS